MTGPGTVWADALAVAAKDLRLEVRSRVATNHVLPFVAVVVMLFGLVFDADATTLRRAESGIFWVTLMFAALIVVQRSAALERADGVTDALRLSGLRPAGIYLGKALACWAQLVAIAVVLGMAMVVVYGSEVRSAGLLAAAGLTGSAAIAAAGGIYGPIASGLAGRETVLSLLLLPVTAPVLLAASRASEVALGRGVGSGWPWVGMLGMLVVIYIALGTITAAPILDET